jgi:hypothetical protein
MQPLAAIVAHGLVVLVAGTFARAQLLVSPQLIMARHAGTDVFGSVPPTGAGSLGLSFSPTSFFNSNTHGHSTPTAGNEVHRSSGYDTVFFSEFPTGPINTAHIQGHAAARSRTGPSTPLNITATATSITRLEFDVTVPVNYHLFGTITLAEVAGNGLGFGTANTRINLSRDFVTLHGFTINAYASGAIPFDFSGTLQPGSYLFEGEAGASGTAMGLNALWSSHATYDARIDFSPIPSPSAGLILAAAFALPRRKRPGASQGPARSRRCAARGVPLESRVVERPRSFDPG